MSERIVVIYGGRKINDKIRFYKFMDKFHAKYKFTKVISGGATGIDTLAIQWAKDRKLQFKEEKAKWQDFSEPCLRKSGPFGDYNALAGTNRNEAMLREYKPRFAIEFPGGTGTADMHKRVLAYKKRGVVKKHIIVSAKKTKEIFVFGSNTAGRHGKGAALEALRKYGAIYGQGEGLQGNSYAIPTKDSGLNTLSLEIIEQRVKKFIKFAKVNSDKRFLVTPIGCGLAGYKRKQIKPFFKYMPDNCKFAKTWES